MFDWQGWTKPPCVLFALTVKRDLAQLFDHPKDVSRLVPMTGSSYLPCSWRGWGPVQEEKEKEKAKAMAKVYKTRKPLGKRVGSFGTTWYHPTL